MVNDVVPILVIPGTPPYIDDDQFDRTLQAFDNEMGSVLSSLFYQTVLLPPDQQDNEPRYLTSYTSHNSTASLSPILFNSVSLPEASCTPVASLSPLIQDLNDFSITSEDPFDEPLLDGSGGSNAKPSGAIPWDASELYDRYIMVPAEFPSSGGPQVRSNSRKSSLAIVTDLSTPQLSPGFDSTSPGLSGDTPSLYLSPTSPTLSPWNIASLSTPEPTRQRRYSYSGTCAQTAVLKTGACPSPSLLSPSDIPTRAGRPYQRSRSATSLSTSANMLTPEILPDTESGLQRRRAHSLSHPCTDEKRPRRKARTVRNSPYTRPGELVAGNMGLPSSRPDSGAGHNWGGRDLVHTHDVLIHYGGLSLPTSPANALRPDDHTLSPSCPENIGHDWGGRARDSMASRETLECPFSSSHPVIPSAGARNHYPGPFLDSSSYGDAQHGSGSTPSMLRIQEDQTVPTSSSRVEYGRNPEVLLSHPSYHTFFQRGAAGVGYSLLQTSSAIADNISGACHKKGTHPGTFEPSSALSTQVVNEPPDGLPSAPSSSLTPFMDALNPSSSSLVENLVQSEEPENGQPRVQMAKIATEAVLKASKKRRKKVAKFQCNVCSQRLTSKDNLINHMCSHYGIRRFLCEFCQERFVTRGVYKRHQRSAKCPGPH